MAHTGPEPKERKHGHTPTVEWTLVENTPYDGPKVHLPKKLLGNSPLPQVKAWWDVVSTMPHCRLWAASDWLFALDTAILKQEFYAGQPPVNLVTEIRRREDQLGTTAEARRKLRIRYVDPVEVPQVSAPTVANLEDRRRRLTNAS